MPPPAKLHIHYRMLGSSVQLEVDAAFIWFTRYEIEIKKADDTLIVLRVRKIGSLTVSAQSGP